MKLKTFKQLNAERAGWRAWRANLSPGKKKKKSKSSSSQAGGPSHKESGSKHALEKPQIIFRTILEFEKDE